MGRARSSIQKAGSGTQESGTAYAIVRRPWGSGSVWCVVHCESDMEIPVWRPYPAHETFLPPILVYNHRSRDAAEQAALEIDWPAVDAYLRTPAARVEAQRIRNKRKFDADYQHALCEARAGREPWPWEPGGLLHREPVRPEATTLFDLPDDGAFMDREAA